MSVTTTPTALSGPGAGGPPGADERPGHPRLTVLAAALSVLGVLALPGIGAWVVDWAVPDRTFPVAPQLTDDAAEVVRLTGAPVVAGKVIVTVRPGTGVTALAPDKRIAPSAVAGTLQQLDVRGLVPMRPDVAPPSIDELADHLTPWIDGVYADVGPLAIGCLADTSAEGCLLTLLSRHGDDYYRFPGQPPARFFAESSPMEARSYDAIGGELVIGRLPEHLPDGDVQQVIVSLADHTIVPATLDRTVSPGDVVWWSTMGAQHPVSATAYDGHGLKIASFLLAGA